MDELEALARFVVIEEPVRDFAACTLTPQEKNPTTELYPSGLVVCPPHKGNWRGALQAQDGGGYVLVYQRRDIDPLPVDLYIDLFSVGNRIASLRANAFDLLAKADELEKAVKATGRMIRGG